jgi:hypothetical protein
MKKSRDLGLDHVKRALANKEIPLSKPELDFVRTSCRILDINSEDMIKSIMTRAIDKGGNQPKRVMANLLPNWTTWWPGPRTTRGPLRPRPSPQGRTTARMRRRVAWRICSSVREG